MGKIICLLFFVCLFSGILCAQTTKISGVVRSATNVEPIVAATILVKDAPVGTVTDDQGHFSFQVPVEAKTLIISCVGMKTLEVGIEPLMEITLEPASETLDEVIVTAIGIKRSEKSLGYAVTQVAGKELTKVREDNILNALSGKIAGVRVTQSSGTLGGSSKIQIRGASSIGSVSSPLFVIDGLPIDNGSYNPDGTTGYVDGGNRIGDISVDDIEFLNVLKGAAATALYGARAKDGVIVITTKKGKKNTGTFISVNSSARFDHVSKLPDFQNEYAQGNEGIYKLNAMNGWGPNIATAAANGIKYPNNKGEEVILQAYPNNVKDFYQTGMTYINNISLSGGGEKTDFRLGFSSHNQEGTIPGSDYNKYVFSLNTGMELAKNFSARISAQYIRSDSEGRPAQGNNDPNLLIETVNALPRTIDLQDFRNNWIDKDGNQIPIMPDEAVTNNPYWTLHKNKYTTNLDRIIGSINLSYMPIDGLTITDNLGTDYYNENRRKLFAQGTFGEMEGKFQEWDITNRIINNDLLVTYEKSWEDFTVKGIAGHNLNQYEWSYTSTFANKLVVDGLYTPGNAKVAIPTSYYEIRRLTGVFFDLGLSYKSLVYMNITGRNDWSSTLPVNNRSYFYPSVSSSFVFSELIREKNILNFGKLRLSYANVGSDERPYQLKYQYFPITTYQLQYSLINTLPHNGLIGFSGPASLPLENLKPQNQRAFEVGGDLRFFNSRICLDFTYYQNVTTNQIVSISVSPSTGYNTNNVNAGKVTNKGVEIHLGLVPVKLPDFRWDIGINFASNRQIVNELTENLTTYSLTSGTDGLNISAEVGKSFGIYGKGWKRDANGEYVINAETGLRETENNVRLGNVFPDFTMGIDNNFTYKGFNLNFLLDIRQGGKLYSGTIAALRSRGLAQETSAGREEQFIEPGVLLNQDGTSIRNNVPVKNMESYWGHIGKYSNTEGSVYDASYVKLRELSFTYSLPQQWFSKFFIRSVDLGIEGRNLWLIKSHIPHIDPEVNLFGPSAIGEGVEFNSVPATRSWGFNIRVTI